jgi:hypothetical protein
VKCPALFWTQPATSGAVCVVAVIVLAFFLHYSGIVLAFFLPCSGFRLQGLLAMRPVPLYHNSFAGAVSQYSSAAISFSLYCFAKKCFF